MNTGRMRAATAGVAERLATRAGTVGELATLLVATGRWWLLPMVGVLLASGVVMGVVTLIEYAAPFVYTIF